MHLIVGKLDSEVASKPYLIYCKPLVTINSSTIARFINNEVKVLWPDGVKEERVLLLYTDATAYMLKAAKSPCILSKIDLHMLLL